MSGEFVLNAVSRGDVGKGASRRLRRGADQVPGIIYGGEPSPQPISVSHKELAKALENEAFFSHLISLSVDDSTQEVILKDLQRHPSKPKILHVDFLRVSKDRKITVHIPLHFVNEDRCYGVKQQGGMIQHSANEVHISCLPKDLPEYIEVDMSGCHVGQSLHLSDLVLPPGVESVALSHGPEHDIPVATVLSPKGGSIGEEESEAEGEQGV